MKKKLILTIFVILLAAAAALGLCLNRYAVVDFQFYPKDAPSLDLRGQTISIDHYEELTRKLPDTQIRWDVPFQGGILADDTSEISVTSLTAEDAAILAKYLPRLRTVHGESCTDYENLLSLKQLRPGVQVDYYVPIDGKTYAGTAVQLTLDGISREELDLLPCLPYLKTVTVTGGEVELLSPLRDYCHEKEISFRLKLGGEALSETDSSIRITGITNEQLPLLHLLPSLRELHLVEPAADAEKILALEDALPGVTVTWEKSILGLTFSQDAVEIDLTDVISLGEGQRLGDKTAYQYSMEYPSQGTREEVPSSVKLTKYHPLPDKTGVTDTLILEVETALGYFPQAQTLLMCGSVLDNETMAAFRERQQDSCKVVWSVKCGNVATRTDAKFFMPVKYHVYYLSDSEAWNLRYCPEMIAVDIGHMNVSDISFVEYMPDLTYLILAHTNIQYIGPIRSCKNLKFLELDWTGIRDLSPLIGCTSLEDVNIGNTGVRIDPLKEMPWLKNIWMIFKSGAYELTQALPNTRVVSSGDATVASGWRDLPNYYAMRDALMMYYMSW